MFKMKIKSKRLFTFMSVFALSMSLAMPVMAATEVTDSAPSTFVKGTSGGVDDTFSDKKQTYDEARDENNASTVISVDNEAKFVVTVPKSIYIKNMKTTGEVAGLSDAKVSIKKCDIAKGQVVKVEVTKEITLTGGSTSEKKIEATFTDDSQIWSLNTASTDDSLVYDSSGASDSRIKDGTIKLVIKDKMNAGIWNGNMEFKVYTTTNSDTVQAAKN